jgi:DNA-binding GntR family transcriptional regulator
VDDSAVPVAKRQGGRTPALAPISHLTLTDNVYQALKRQILKLELAPGTRIRDEDIAAQLGVSRTPVREAILGLIRDGLVEVVPRSKTRVCTLSETDINQIFDLRIALESLAARLSAGRVPAGELANLDRLYRRAEAGLKGGDARSSLEFDHAMHQLILEYCGNPRLISMMGTVNDFVTLFRNLGAQTPTHKGFNYRHREILLALKRADGAAAAKAVEEHILMAKQQTQHDFQQARKREAFEKSGRPSRARK